jgi:hypothetical protein
MSEEKLSRNKFYQRTIHEYRRTFFSTQNLAQKDWCRSKFAGECSMCEQFGHRRPKCPLRIKNFDNVYRERPALGVIYQTWLQSLSQSVEHASVPPQLTSVHSVDSTSRGPPPLRRVAVHMEDTCTDASGPAVPVPAAGFLCSEDGASAGAAVSVPQVAECTASEGTVSQALSTVDSAAAGPASAPAVPQPQRKRRKF